MTARTAMYCESHEDSNRHPCITAFCRRHGQPQNPKTLIPTGTGTCTSLPCFTPTRTYEPRLACPSCESLNPINPKPYRAPEGPAFVRRTGLPSSEHPRSIQGSTGCQDGAFFFPIDVEALVRRICFGGMLYYDYNKEPPGYFGLIFWSPTLG